MCAWVHILRSTGNIFGPIKNNSVLQPTRVLLFKLHISLNNFLTLLPMEQTSFVTSLSKFGIKLFYVTNESKYLET